MKPEKKKKIQAFVSTNTRWTRKETWRRALYVSHEKICRNQSFVNRFNRDQNFLAYSLNSREGKKMSTSQ